MTTDPELVNKLNKLPTDAQVARSLVINEVAAEVQLVERPSVREPSCAVARAAAERVRRAVRASITAG